MSFNTTQACPAAQTMRTWHASNHPKTLADKHCSGPLIAPNPNAAHLFTYQACQVHAQGANNHLRSICLGDAFDLSNLSQAPIHVHKIARGQTQLSSLQNLPENYTAVLDKNGQPKKVTNDIFYITRIINGEVEQMLFCNNFNNFLNMKPEEIEKMREANKTHLLENGLANMVFSDAAWENLKTYVYSNYNQQTSRTTSESSDHLKLLTLMYKLHPEKNILEINNWVKSLEYQLRKGISEHNAIHKDYNNLAALITLQGPGTLYVKPNEDNLLWLKALKDKSSQFEKINGISCVRSAPAQAMTWVYLSAYHQAPNHAYREVLVGKFGASSYSYRIKI